MAGEVVGTAFVRIKAITKGLGKDIEKSVKKGLADANLDKAGEGAGEELGTSLGDSTVDSASDRIKKRSDEIVPQSALDDMRKKFKEGGPLADIDVFPPDAEAKLRSSLDRINKNISEGFGEGAGGLSDTEVLSDADVAKLQRNYEKQVGKVRSNLFRINQRMGESFPVGGWPYRATLISDAEVQKINRQHESQFNKVRSNLFRINQSLDKAFPQGDGRGPLGKSRKDVEDDSSAIGNLLDNLGKKMKSFGGQGTPSFGGFFTKALSGIAGLAVAALPYIQDLGSGILAYGTGIVAQLGFMTTAAVGLAAAAGAAIGSALLPILPIMLAFKAESDVLVEFKDSMKAAGEEFMRIGLATQETLLPGLDRAVFQLGELIPMFEEFGSFVGLAVGNFAELAATTLTGGKAQGRFGDILRSSLRILDILLPTLLNLGDLLSGLWVAAIPASERFVASLANMVQYWTDIINIGLNSGTLTATLDTWYDRAELLGSALSDVFGALFDILSVGANSADNLFVRFDAWAGRFRDFTESEVGRNKLALIFDNSLAVIREVNGVLTELVDGIFGRLDDVGGVDSMVATLQRVQEVLPGIKEQFQGFIDQIRDVNSILGPQLKAKFEQAFNELKEPLGRLVFAVVDILSAMEESGAFEVFLDLLHVLADVLTTILSIPGFGTFIGYMLAFKSAALVATFALGPLVSIMGPFVAVIGQLLKLKAGTTLLGAAQGLLGFGAAAKKAAAATAAADAIAKTGAAAGAAGKAVKAGGLVGALGKVGPALGTLGPWGIAAGVGIAAAATAFHFATKDSKAFDQEVRQLTASLGLLNGGVNIAAEGLAKYLTEESRFQSRNQDDDILRMGTTFEELAEKIATGSISYVDFAESAISAGEVTTRVSKVLGSGQSTYDNVGTSLKGLQKQYGLTSAELTKLAMGDEVYKNGVGLVLDGNDDLIESFQETIEALGQSSKDTIDTFAGNAQNIRLLGRDNLIGIAEDIKAADDGQAGLIMIDTQESLREKAAASAESITGLSDAMRDQIREQSRLADGTIDVIKQEQLLYNEQQKLFAQIRDNLELYMSRGFNLNFNDTKREILEFSTVLDQFGLDTKKGFEGFQLTAAFEGIDVLMERFPGVGAAASELFDTLSGLPEAEFNAAAQAMNADADSLREAMSGAQQAIADLQETALSKLPSIQEALDQNFKTEEDGTQYFDTAGFKSEAEKRIQETGAFATNLQKIFDSQGREAALLALQQGPESAAALTAALAADEAGVNEIMAKMEWAKGEVTGKVEELFGDAVAAEYFAKVKPVGDAMGLGVTAGLNSPATFQALAQGGTGLLNSLVKGFRGRFVWDGLGLRFVREGAFSTGDQLLVNFKPKGGGGVTLKSAGGFVGTGPFGSGPVGTDTIPAWLTPGEFVLRQSVARSIPASILNSLNAGDPRLISLLSSLDRNRPGNPATAALTGIPPVQTGRPAAGGVVIQQMNIQAPTPYESSRQVVNRLRILQSQVGQG